MEDIVAKDNNLKIELIHEKELELFDTFVRICKRHNLRYFAIQGTTLGAIFWDGFIPWDDDIDLAMPLDDYRKFTKIVDGELPSTMQYIESQFSGGKITDLNSTFIEATLACTPEKWHGVFIDIVPLIALPNEEKKRRSFCQDMQQYHLEALKYEKYPKACNTNIEKLNKWKEKLVTSEDYDKAEYVTDFSFGYYYKFKADGFRNPVKRKFCNRDINISSTYDYDLKSRYGTYKKYPNDNTKYAHNEYSFIDLNKSFKDYKDDFKKSPKWVIELIEKERDLEGEYYSSFQWLKNQNEILTNELKRAEKNIASMVSCKSLDYRIGNNLLRIPRYIKRKLNK